jgi:endo-1,4-beta-xylanase
LLDRREMLAGTMSAATRWLQAFAPRDDKLPQRCCPYDPDGRPKPLYRAIEAALMRRASRR